MISSVQSWPYGFEEELQKLHPKINNIEKKKSAGNPLVLLNSDLIPEKKF